MRNIDKQRPSKASWVLIVSGLVGVAVNVALLVWHYSGAVQSKLDDLNQRKMSEFSSSVTDSAVGSSLFIDTILSIVQNYYVDEDRVANNILLKQTLRSLALRPDVQLQEQDNVFKLTVGDQFFSGKFPSYLSYHRLVSLLSGVSSILDRHLKGADQSVSGDALVLNALLTGLDAHSSLLRPEAYKELRQGTEGAFGGLGVLVGVRQNILTVIKPLPRSPAKRAEIHRRDKILSINGVRTYGLTLDQLVEHMRGEPGTKVSLDILREGSWAPATIPLKREIIVVDSVTSETYQFGEYKFLHMTIESFSSRTGEEVREALNKFRRNNGKKISGVILDLRSNPGGLLDQAVAVSDVFLKSGVIVSTKGRRSEVESATGRINESDFPLVALINSDSASASEIVAGALQDHGGAIIVGQPSFGKGSVQTIFELPGEQALKLTIARYYTPLGRSIQNVGIMPDVWLQPVVEGDRNQDLMGRYRYKNERFLRNHLHAISDRSNLLSDSHSRSLLKGFYLVGKNHDEFNDDNMRDYELKTAGMILAKVRDVYADNLKKSGFRSQNWLAIAKPTIQKFILNLGRKVQEWAHRKHSVIWKVVSKLQPVDSQIKVGISKDLNQVTVKAGRVVQIPWWVMNKSTKPLQRISVFVNSNEQAVDTMEILVGEVKANSTKKGVLEFKVHPGMDLKNFNIRLGVAVDAIASGSFSRNIPVVVTPEDPIKIDALVSLTEELGGVLPGVLEAGEKAVIVFNIGNESRVSYDNLQARIVNLSGKQIRLLTSESKVDHLAAYNTVSVRVPVEASERIMTNSIELGLELSGKSLPKDIHKSVTISAKPEAISINKISVSH